MIKEMIVVEGKDDTAAIRRAVEADTIETGGSAIGRSRAEANCTCPGAQRRYYIHRS